MRSRGWFPPETKDTIEGGSAYGENERGAACSGSEAGSPGERRAASEKPPGRPGPWGSADAQSHRRLRGAPGSTGACPCCPIRAPRPTSPRRGAGGWAPRGSLVSGSARGPSSSPAARRSHAGVPAAIARSICCGTSSNMPRMILRPVWALIRSPSLRDGHLEEARLAAADGPGSVRELWRVIQTHLPRIRIEDLLVEVDWWCGFTRHLPPPGWHPLPRRGRGGLGAHQRAARSSSGPGASCHS